MNSGRSRRKATGEQGRALPHGYLFARFVQVYGMAAWHSPAWPTRDRVIPFQLFYAMIGALANVTAADQLTAYYAALLAGAQVHGGTDGRSERDRAVRSLVDTAFPTLPGVIQ